MKKLILIILILLAGCGGGGVDTSSGIPVGKIVKITDFEGDYVMRDHSCTYIPPRKMSITHVLSDLKLPNSIAVTIVDPGEVNAKKGDFFFGGLLADGITVYFPILECKAKRIVSENQADKNESLTSVVTIIGDLAVICSDELSSDFECAVSYKPN